MPLLADAFREIMYGNSDLYTVGMQTCSACSLLPTLNWFNLYYSLPSSQPHSLVLVDQVTQIALLSFDSSVSGICFLCEKSPEFRDRHSFSRQHAILQTVQVTPMDRRNRLAIDQTERNT